MKHTPASYAAALLRAKRAEAAGDIETAIRAYTECIDFLMNSEWRSISDPDLQSALNARRRLYALRRQSQ
jgi:hypothetical protein